MADDPKPEILPRKTALTIVAVLAMLAAVPLLPGKKLSGLDPGWLGTLFLGKDFSAKSATSTPAVPKKATVEEKTSSSLPHVAGPNLTVPPGSLTTFFQALARTDRKEPGAVTRILHYGDSPTTADSITADVRSQLQARFGDGGHGFLLIAKPWAWYGHRGIELSASGWKIEPASMSRAKDGVHGLGGVSFRGNTGAHSRVRLPDGGTTLAVVYYWSQPDGGTFELRAGDQVLQSISTASDEAHPGFAEIPLPAGTSEVELVVTAGSVRAFGYRFDKPGPGVQYSSIGINGAQVQMLVRFFEVNQWTANLRHEHPDLVILNYGTNESIFPDYVRKQYPGELRTVISRLRAALPDASIMIMSPMDRGTKNSAGDISTPETLPALIEVQRRIAAETGCAFFDTFDAMGGAGTMGRWYNEQPRLVSADFMHPLPGGAARVGTLFEGSLLKAYDSYQSSSPQQRDRLAQDQKPAAGRTAK